MELSLHMLETVSLINPLWSPVCMYAHICTLLLCLSAEPYLHTNKELWALGHP